MLLNDDDTATPWFDAPSPVNGTVLTFEATAKGRGTSGGGASKGDATAQVTVPGRPSIDDVSVTSRPLGGGATFKEFDKIEITATFSEPVRANVGGGINIYLRVGTGGFTVAYDRQDHPNKLIFRHVVVAANRDTDGFIIGRDSTTGLHDTGVDDINLIGSASIRAVADNTNARVRFDVKQTTWNVNGTQAVPNYEDGVCDRGIHPKVLAAMARAVPGTNPCNEITSADLALITSLDVSGQDVDSLRKADFEGLTILTTLNLANNQLDYLPSDLFDHVTTLKELKLNGNAFASVPGNGFNRLRALEKLELQSNALTELPAGVFNQLTALKKLDLRSNGLTELPAGVFNRLTKLLELKLSDNAIAALPNNVFNPLTKLTLLWLADNPGLDSFVPTVTMTVPAQTARPGEQVDLEAVPGTSPWGDNVTWSWSQTDTSGTTVTLVDVDTRSVHFVAPEVTLETELTFEATATGRGTAGVASPSRATADAAVTVEDVTPPTLASAVVPAAGDQLKLTFNEDLGNRLNSMLPPADAFTVKADGVEVTVQSVAVGSGLNQFNLLLPDAAIIQEQLVTVSYAVPAIGTAIEDTAGNDALSFTDAPVVNESTVADTAPPVLVGAEVLASSNTLTLFFNEDLDIAQFEVPSASAFTVKADGAVVAVESATVGTENDHFNLIFQDTGAIKMGQTVTVSYTVPTDGSKVIEDTDGNDALPFTDREVVNNSTVDGTPPVLASAEVAISGDTLTLTFNEVLDNGSGKLPPASAFTVQAGGADVPVQDVAADAGKKKKLTLNLSAEAIKAGQTVTVSYTVPTDDSTVIEDTAGNDALSFTDASVTNSSTAIFDVIPPELTSAEVLIAGNEVRLIFNEDLDFIDNPPRSSAFTVKADGARVTVTSITVAPYRQIELKLPTGETFKAGQTVTVSYAVLDSRNLRDLAGNDALPFTNEPVENNSTVDGTPPELARATVPAEGGKLTLTFDEDLDNGAGKLPPASAFTVKADGAEVAVESVAVGTGMKKLILNLPAEAIKADQTVTVSYAVPTDGSTVIEDTAGNDALSFTDEPVENSSTVDGTPPKPASAEVAFDGSDVTLIFNEDLDFTNGNSPRGSAFTVKVDGAVVAVSSVGLDSNLRLIRLNVSAVKIQARQIVTVSYALLDTRAVRDLAGNKALPFTDRPVDNKSTVANTTPPALASAAVKSTGDTLTLTFNEVLDISADYPVPPTDAFTAKADGVVVPLVQLVPITADGRQITVFTKASVIVITEGQTVTLSYTVPGDDDNPLLGIDGNKVAAFTDSPVVNNSTVDVTPPALTGAEAPAAGDRVVLTFDDDMARGDDQIPPAAAFTVKADSAAVLVQSVAAGAGTDELILNLFAGAITAGQTVTVTYTVPVSGAVLEDTDGNDAEDFTDEPVVNHSTAIFDVIPPEFMGATAPEDGGKITLTFNEDLDNGADKLPPASAFTVQADGAGVTVQSVAVGAGTDDFILILDAEAIKAGQVVTVSYTVPTSTSDHAIQDPTGNKAAAFTDAAVTNSSTVDGTPPVLASAAAPAAGDRLTLTFNENLDNGSGKLPPASAFTVKADGAGVTVQSVAAGAGTDELILNLSAEAIREGQAVTVSYAVPTTGAVIEDTAGNDALSFTDAPVVNHSTVTPPELTRAEVPASGDQLILTFNEDLDIGVGRLPPKTAFTIKVGGAVVAVQSVARRGAGTKEFILVLPPAAINDVHVVTVSYAVPTDGSTVIEDTDGYDALPFTDRAVDNHSTVQPTRPELTRAVVPPSGDILTLTFNEDLDNGPGRLPPANSFTVKAHGAVVAVLSVAVGGDTDELTLNLPAAAIGRNQIVTVSYAVPLTYPIRNVNYDALPFTDRPVVNGSTVDLTPPELDSAEVLETGGILTLTLVFNEDLDLGPGKPLPAKSAFTVKADDVEVAVQSVAVGGDTAELTLNLSAQAIGAGQTVTVSYAVPRTNAIRDVDGDDALPFTDWPVVNGATVDLTPPVLDSAAVTEEGDILTLTFNEDLDNAGRLPPANSFTVKADGVQVAVQSVVGGDTAELTLNLPAQAITKNQTVTVSYALLDTRALRDVDGNKTVAFTDRAVVNNSGVTPPKLQRAVVATDGEAIELHFNVNLDFVGNTPSGSSFTVKIDGADVPVDSISLGGSNLKRFTLSLPDDATVTRRQIVTLGYARPATRALRDLAGDYALPFTDRRVNNTSTVANTTPPVLDSAEVEASGTTLTLTFNEALDNGVGTLPPETAFTVKANGDVVTVQSVAVGGDTDELTLTLPAGGIKEDQTVTVSYGVPATNPLQDVDDNTTVAFTDSPVVNGSTVTVDLTPPELTSAVVLGTGDTLTLTFNEDLDIGPTTLPPASAFTVKANGVVVTVQSVAVGGGADELTLSLTAGGIKEDQTVTVSYGVPATNPLQDVDGNTTVAFTDREVVNNSTVDVTLPELAGAVVLVSGDRLILTFDEDLDIGPGKLPPAGAFTVKANGVTVDVQSVVVGAGTDEFILNLPAAAIGEGHPVTVSYTVPTDGSTVIEDTDGNDALSFTDAPVVNHSRIEGRGALLIPSPLVVDEGTTGSYTVELTEEPTGTVAVTIAGHAGTDVTLSDTQLTFTTTDWNSPQTVSVTALEDGDAVDDTVTLTHTVSTGGGYDGVTLPDLEVTVADNDGGIVADPASLTVAEGGTGSYVLTLTRRPTSPVTVNVTAVGGGVTVDPATLTFTATDWDMEKMVTVTGSQDTDKNDETVTLRHAATGGGYAVVAGDAHSALVAVTVHDDEATVPGAPELRAAAGNQSATLDWTPPGDDGGTQVTGYEYDRDGGAAEAAGDGDARTYTVDGLANGTDYTFRVRAVNRIGQGGWSPAQTVRPVPRTLRLTPSALVVDEGTSGSYTVELTEAPTGTVTVTIAGATGTDVTLSDTQLTFTTTTWDSPQTVSVTAREDDDAVDDTVTLTFTVSGGGYDGVTLPDLEVTVADNDGGIVADPASLTVAEGVTGSYGLTLTRRPTTPVTVNVTAVGGGVTANPATLTFTADNFATAQTVSVTGSQDADKNDETVTLRHAATGAATRWWPGMCAAPR